MNANNCCHNVSVSHQKTQQIFWTKKLHKKHWKSLLSYSLSHIQRHNSKATIIVTMFSPVPHIFPSHHYVHKLKSAQSSLSSLKTKNKNKKKKGYAAADDDEEKDAGKTQGLKWKKRAFFHSRNSKCLWGIKHHGPVCLLDLAN